MYIIIIVNVHYHYHHQHIHKLEFVMYAKTCSWPKKPVCFLHTSFFLSDSVIGNVHCIPHHHINPITARVVGAPQMILQPVFSIFPCSSLPSGTCRTPGLSIPWYCLPTSSSVCLVFFPLSLCLARWFWPDLINRKHDNTTAVCVSLWLSGLCVV